MYAVVALPPPKKYQREQSSYDVAAIIADHITSGLPTISTANHIREYGFTVFFDDHEDADNFFLRLIDQLSYFEIGFKKMVSV